MKKIVCYLATVLHDERGDLVQNIVLLLGGILATIGIAVVLYNTITAKIANDSAGMSKLN
ncbi:hypothetical protein UNSWDHB_2820 [Dehalobacter sp. UNSWDHB]|uniref:hypothetical protein n=1 Tax=unclassified Dehalobacter TaxID=2635733 RepID=UPI0003878AC0|nr:MULTISPECIES: hypothetical protein [unclassified Dehalobacter]EQB19884.1 hypothetical protein UNSWDHB_2820 [Dehalobacter sp. UNSWDHB]OCZ49952.1 hypothetical protein A7D23_00980 [Dehalobacter sp. TeCB1]